MKMNFPHLICKKKRTSTKKWEPLMLLAELACQESDKLLLLLPNPEIPNNQENAEEEEKTSTTKKRKKMMGEEEEKTTIVFKKAKKMKKIKKETKQNKKMTTRDDHIDPEPEPAPHCSLEAHYKNMVSSNDSGLIHVCDKTLTKTDVDRGQNRLLLPTKAVHDTLLPAFGYSLKDEKGVLSAPGIAVIGLDPLGRAWNLQWKFWTKYHVLDGQWKNLVVTNGLKARLHSIHVTAFRYGEANCHICFVVTTTCSASASASTSQDQATPSTGPEQQGQLNS